MNLLSDLGSPAMIAAALSLLFAAACFLLRSLAARKTSGETRQRIAAIAAEVVATADSVLAQAPDTERTILSLRAAVDGKGDAGLRYEERLLEDLLVRARVVKAAACALLEPGATDRLSPRELHQRLQRLQVDVRRIDGIRDTFEAKSWVLQRSEEAIRRTLASRLAPTGRA